MPYASDSNQKNVMELQFYLRTLARFKENIPLIVPDGIFGTETTEALQAFQKSFDLNVTGRADEETWNRLYSEYLTVTAAVQKPIAIDAFSSPDLIVQEGSSGEIVFFLQLMLIRLGEYFHNIPKIKLSGRFQSDTESAVKKMQQKSGLPENGKVDRFTWDMIAKAYHVFSRTIFSVKNK